MARRTFRLPRVQDLSKDQERVRSLPLDGQHLVIGGPGTGKSVLALLRAKRLARSGRKYVVLMYNHLLKQASHGLYRGQLSCDTWKSWYWRVFKELTNHDVPLVSDTKEGAFRPFDWKRIDGIIEQTESDDQRLNIVIDEGQDMPPEFYSSLVGMGFENFFVVADQNQQITDENSSRRDIENALAIDTNEVIELRTNFRNSRSVAKLAHTFYTGDPASPPPSLPRHPDTRAPELYSYSPDQFPQIIRRILLTADRNPHKLVGIIAPKNAVREKYLSDLRSMSTSEIISLRHGKPMIRTFSHGSQADIKLDSGGIVILNIQACKGQEFEIVICVDIDEHYVPAGDLEMVKKHFYVMVARAREKVVMLRRKGVECRIDRILPVDESILQRKEI